MNSVIYFLNAQLDTKFHRIIIANCHRKGRVWSEAYTELVSDCQNIMVPTKLVCIQYRPLRARIG